MNVLRHSAPEAPCREQQQLACRQDPWTQSDVSKIRLSTHVDIQSVLIVMEVQRAIHVSCMQVLDETCSCTHSQMMPQELPSLHTLLNILLEHLRVSRQQSGAHF